MPIPFAGTVIGADGKRYANNDSDIPTEPPAPSGKYVTSGALAAERDDFDSRTVADAVMVNADATVTSVAANFTDADEGAELEGDDVPVGATIETVNAENSIEMSAPATGAGTGNTLRIKRKLSSVVNDLDARVDDLESA